MPFDISLEEGQRLIAKVSHVSGRGEHTGSTGTRSAHGAHGSGFD